MYSEVGKWMPSVRFGYVLCRVSVAIYDSSYTRTAVCWVIARVVVIFYRRFGTTYPSHLQGSRMKKSVVLIYFTAEV
jgi:hypothetical protein